jgi:hypothetical protein
VAFGLLLLVAMAQGLIWPETSDDRDWIAFGVSLADLAGTILGLRALFR